MNSLNYLLIPHPLPLFSSFRSSRVRVSNFNRTFGKSFLHCLLWNVVVHEKLHERVCIFFLVNKPPPPPLFSYFPRKISRIG